MRKILLIGPGGAGKSALAGTLGSRTGLPVIHLDALFWNPGWQPTPPAEWRDTVAALVRQEAWIIDGNFGGTLDLRLGACDTVLFLDVPPHVCLWRVLRRRVRFHGVARPDMAPGCHERLDASFIGWILGYRWRQRPRVLRRLAPLAEAGKRVVVLRTQRDVDAFLAGIAAPAATT